MKYELSVQVNIRPEGYSSGQLDLRETQIVELTTLSDAAGVLVKLHEFFEALKARKA
jgi:hypothetical protein